MNSSTACTQRLKELLWSRFGTPEHPAEWDGHHYGGGLLSQRYWEYFITAEMLGVNPEAKVLDIGGGSPVTGAGFFAALLAQVCKEVNIVDPNLGAQKEPEKTRFFPQIANYQNMCAIFEEFPGITHVCCVSVLEHIPPAARLEIFKAINEKFTGDKIALTFEYHPRVSFFEHQLTAATMSEMLKPLTRFFPLDIRSSPVLCENALAEPLAININVPGRKWMGRFGANRNPIPLWYPLAVSFNRISG